MEKEGVEQSSLVFKAPFKESHLQLFWCVKSKQKKSGLTDECPVPPTREYRPRENVTFLENGTKVFALNPKSFVFVPEKSAGDPKVDIIRTVNIPFVVSFGIPVTGSWMWHSRVCSQNFYCFHFLKIRPRNNGIFSIPTFCLQPSDRRIVLCPSSSGGHERAELLLLLPANLCLHVHEHAGYWNVHDPHRARGPVGLQRPSSLQDPLHEAWGGRTFWADVEGKPSFVVPCVLSGFICRRQTKESLW